METKGRQLCVKVFRVFSLNDSSTTKLIVTLLLSNVFELHDLAGGEVADALHALLVTPDPWHCINAFCGNWGSGSVCVFVFLLESQIKFTSSELETRHLDSLKHICQTHSRSVCTIVSHC